MTASVMNRAIQETGVRARRAGVSDLPALADVLVAAFVDDPVMTWLIPDRRRRPEILRAVLEITIEVNHPYGELYITDPARIAGAIWIPPGCQPTGEDAERLVARYLEAAAETAERAAVGLELMDERHPREPHDYLFWLGTMPEWRSRGIGSLLLREVLDRCDRQGRPAYLEASSADNRRLYLRHGFEVIGEIVLPDGPTMWCMWREPAPGRTARVGTR